MRAGMSAGVRRMASGGIAACGGPTISAASSTRTHTSFAIALRGRRPDSLSSSVSARANPPRIARQRMPSCTRNTRSTMRRGSIAFAPTQGATDGWNRATAANCQGAAAMSAVSLRAASGAIALRSCGVSAALSADRISHPAGSASTTAREAGSPSQSIGTLGSANCSSSRRGARSGRKPLSAGVSANSLPGSLKMWIAPPRAASSRPGMPAMEAWKSISSGSTLPPACRRSRTSTGCNPRSVLI